MPARPLSRNSTIVACVPTATISCGARLVGEQHRDVLARAVGDELDVRRRPTRGGSRGPARDRRGARGARARRRSAARASRHRVEVADDDVGLEPDLEQRVGAAVDADQHRLVLADVRPQRREVAAVVVAAHDDQRVPALELGAQRRQLERLERELAPRAGCTRACSRRTARARCRCWRARPPSRRSIAVASQHRRRSRRSSPSRQTSSPTTRTIVTLA